MRQGPWIVGGSILLGIALGTLSFSIPFPSLIFLGLGLCLILLRTFRFSQQQFVLGAFVLLLVSFWYGQAYLNTFLTSTPQWVEKASYRITGVPEEKDFYQSIQLTPTGQNFFKREQKVLWQAPLALVTGPGERIFLTCDLTTPENFSPDFNYRLYLAKEGVAHLCEEAAAFEEQEDDVFTSIFQAFYTPRNVLEAAISKSIPEPEAGLAKGLLLGGSSHMSRFTEEQFTRLGLTHIVAVSGYNIVILVNAFLALGLALYLWRKPATLFAFFGTMFFILMIGAPASATRAGLMAAAAFGAFLIGRISYSLLAVLSTATLMVLWNPLYLWYDAGFQLSFLATIGVILAMRAVEGKLTDHKIGRMLQEIVWLSVWVYLFLLPLLLFQFQSLTILSIPANILFLPVIPFAMMSSFMVAIVTLVLPSAAVIVGWIAYLPLTYVLRGTSALSQIPGISVPAHISLGIVIVWYIFLLFVIVRMEEQRKQKRYEKNFHCPKSTRSAHHH